MQNELLEQFRDSARDLLGRADQRQRVRRLRDESAGFERTVWQEIGAAGWLAIMVPEADGGLGLGLAEVAAVAEIVGQQLLPEPFIGAGVHALAALCATPASALRSELIAAASSGQLIAGLAWQETAGQLEPGRTRTSLHAAPDQGGHLRLSGEMRFVCPGEGADGWIVLAEYTDAPSLLWVRRDTAGVSCCDTARIDGSRMAVLRFSDALVPRASLLASGADAIAAVEVANESARIAASAELLGIARQALALTLDYMKTRIQFGKAIGSFQALQHRAVDAYIQVELAAAGLAAALSRVKAPDGSEPRALLCAAASRSKARCAEAALHVTQFALQMHGAVGFTDECDIGLYYKRALHLGAWLGNAAAHRVRYFDAVGSLPVLPEDDGGAGDAPDASAGIDFPHDANWDAMPDAQFRQMIRAFFKRHYPQQLRHLSRRLHWDEIKEWYFTLSRQGWIAPAWPKAFGGMGLTAEKHLAFIEEQERYGVARMIDAGLTMAGPLLIRYGTPEQQQAYLPKILSGEHIWSQGYSEPNAGSDLAALRTDAVLDDDGTHFIVNGQKTWTTMAQDCTHIFMLVRTASTGKPQAGISFLLADIRTPGITVRVIKDLVGHEHFCEVFFDNVRVPKENLVGEINQGWTIAKALLGFERIFLGNPRQSQNALAQLHTYARDHGLFENPLFIDQYARLLLEVDDLSALYASYADMVKRGDRLPPSVSQLKIWATETYRKIGLVAYEAGQEYGGNHPVETGDASSDNLLTPLINSAAATIYGGANEIQRNILARTVLELPD
ncbi:MAG: acyl-CoA dehydrogenase [Pseudomonadota bacterium]